MEQFQAFVSMINMNECLTRTSFLRFNYSCFWPALLDPFNPDLIMLVFCFKFFVNADRYNVLAHVDHNQMT